MDLDIAPVAGRTELYEQLDGLWPVFVTKDPTGAFFYRHFDEFWPEFTLLAVDRATGRAVAKAQPDLRGTGLSGRMLAALRDNAGRLGFTDLVAPVRPSGRTEQTTPIDVYAYEKRADGLPLDPWIRVHVRAGGRIVNVAHTSMVAAGTLEQWRSWTGLPFDRTGPVVVPGALTPVHCDVEQDHAVYVEPNVWIHHRTVTAPAGPAGAARG